MVKAAPRRPPLPHEKKRHVTKVNQVKKYLIVKTMMEGLNQAASLIALPGFYSLEAAQQLVTEALAAEPHSKYVIQEVGAA
jgi:hypothetical protein